MLHNQAICTYPRLNAYRGRVQPYIIKLHNLNFDKRSLNFSFEFIMLIGTLECPAMKLSEEKFNM